MKQEWTGPLQKIDDYRWRIPKSYNPGMKVPGLIYADEALIKDIRSDRAAEQVANVAHLPGIVKYSLAMPDIHWGYGFCLAKGAKILSNLGFYKTIENFENDWPEQLLRSVDLNSKKIIETSISRFIKLKPKEIFVLTTKNGYKIKATEDHPLLTPSGMRPIKELSSKEKVAMLPFQGVPYETPSDKIVISKEDIRKTLLRLGRKPDTPKFEIILQKLEERNLLNLTYKHPKLPYILKIMGFVFGDASINFIGKRGDGIIGFAGNPQDLELARTDLKKIGYTPGPIHLQRKKASRNSNKYYNCYSFVVNASSLVVLLETLGVPRGIKVNQAYRVPKWIFKAPLWQKRLFLASLFGCELRKPHRRLNRKGYFNVPVFPMAKRENLIKNGKDFLKDISKLLKEFGVSTLYIDKRKRHVSTKGNVSWALELLISSRPENLFNLWSKVGFEYNLERSFIANIAVQYLKLKKKILKEKAEAIKVTIPRLLKNGLSYQKIALQLAGNPLTKRFIIDVCWKLNKGRKIIPRIPTNFPLFEDYLKEVTKGLGESGVVWDAIEKIEKIPYQEPVYDFTVSHSDHNFIADNFIVSNCIGGVAATDIEADGVISPGGVGYDINCLSGNSLILNELGYSLPIEEYEKRWHSEKINHMNFDKKMLGSTKIFRFLKQRPKDTVYKMTTKTGRSIVATADHPFYTKDGMNPLTSVSEGDNIAIYPFEGIHYESPQDEIILTEEDIKKALLDLEKDSRGHGLEQILIYLKKRNLLPLRFSSSQLPYLLKIMGYIFGDGTVYFANKRGSGMSWFYGQPEDLEDIRRDILKIGFTPSKIYYRNRDHKIKTLYGEYKFNRTESSFKVSSSSFAILLVALGVPLGKKTDKDYRVPSWIFKASLWHKRLFLAAFFGAEMSSPKTLTNHNYNFYSPTLSMNKLGQYENSARRFLEDISMLLKEFGVPTKKIGKRMEYINKDGWISYRFRIILSNLAEDMIAFYSKVGFEYNRKKRCLANAAIQYLKLKQMIIKSKEKVAVEAQRLKQETGWGAKKIYQYLDSSAINLRFIQRSIYEGRKTMPRMWLGNPNFKQFLEAATEGLGCSGMIWDEVVSKEKIEFKDYVYDFTVEHKDHNFIANNFVVSNCGVRLVRTNLREQDIKPRLKDLVYALFNNIPAGLGSKGDIRVNAEEEKKLLVKGAKWAVEKGYGRGEDLDYCEEKGAIAGALPDKVSDRAYERGKKQSGTLGSGNHFIEVQVIDEIYDEEAARVCGLDKGRITIMIHSGSRGLGYQVCDEYAKDMIKTLAKYGISVPDRQLACAPVNSPHGKAYLGAMRCAANYAWANRQCLMHLVRLVFEKFFNRGPRDLGMDLVYDIAHNIAKIEKHTIDGKEKTLCVHRKGATRAFPPGHPDIPPRYKTIGQPVIIPGDMGRNSFLLVGTDRAMQETFGSTCHGAGRVMSRSAAIKATKGRSLQRELEAKGIIVMATGRGTLGEEAPEAYKDVNEVVHVVHEAGIAKRVCRMRPLGVIKG